ncbi:MAG: LPS export ABC transporter permease LptF [Deltaproteobacteria bacterium]|nr:LPS export ABC transporter permease LptF [Deltaproteobacteria bacterium]
MKKIIFIYIVKDILPSFFINLLVFTFILLMGKILQLTDLVVVRGVKAWTIINLMGMSLPFFLSMTIPMATLLAVLMTFMRLSTDSEITVFKASGISLYQLLPPVMSFSFGAFLLTAYLTLSLVPAANWAFRLELLELAKARADVSLKERVFNVGFKKMVILVNHMSMDSDLMENIFIQDERDPEVVSVIVAARGRIATDSDQGALIFQLFDGVIDRVRRDRQATDTTDFMRYELKMDIEGELGNPELMQRNQSELTTEELWATAEKFKEQGNERYPVYIMDAHKRYSLPIACLVFGLIGVPLGVQFRIRGRNSGITIGLAVFLFYYILLTAGWSLGKSISSHPALGMWLPDILVGALGLYLFRQADKGYPIKMINFLNSAIVSFQKVWRGLRT